MKNLLKSTTWVAFLSPWYLGLQPGWHKLLVVTQITGRQTAVAGQPKSKILPSVKILMKMPATINENAYLWSSPVEVSELFTLLHDSEACILMNKAEVAFYNLALDVTQYHFGWIPLAEADTSLSKFKGKVYSLHFLMRRVSKNFWLCYKSTIGSNCIYKIFFFCF